MLAQFRFIRPCICCRRRQERHLYLRRLGAAEPLLHLDLEVAAELAAVQQGETGPRLQAVLGPGVPGGVAVLIQRGWGGIHHHQVC